MLYNTHGSVDATLWPTIDTEEHFTAKNTHTHTPVYLRTEDPIIFRRRPRTVGWSYAS